MSLSLAGFRLQSGTIFYEELHYGVTTKPFEILNNSGQLPWSDISSLTLNCIGQGKRVER